MGGLIRTFKRQRLGMHPTTSTAMDEDKVEQTGLCAYQANEDRTRLEFGDIVDAGEEDA